MFSESIAKSVHNVVLASGWEMELVGAGFLACGVIVYLGRVTWIALSEARRMELKAIAVEDGNYHGPNSAG